MNRKSGSDTRCIVIVDDDDSICLALARLLRLHGYAPCTYRDAQSLLASDSLRNIACLVLDVNLPGATGIQLYHDLVRGKWAPPVVFMTAYDDAKTRAAAQRAGAHAYLVKPFPSQVLLDAIERALGEVPC